MKSTDKKTLALIEEVNRRKKEIAKAERPNWKTNCAYTLPNGAIQNLQVVSSVEDLVKIVAHIRSAESAYTMAAKELGLSGKEVPAFMWQGFSADDWCSDVKTRLDKVQISSKKKYLEQLESKLNQLISPEMKAELELQAISDELGLK